MGEVLPPHTLPHSLEARHPTSHRWKCGRPKDGLAQSRYLYFALNRPLSPTTSTTSSSSSTMTSPFQSPGNPVPSVLPDVHFRRHSTNGVELTLHSGTAHISVTSNEERYRMAAPCRPTNGPDSQPFPMMPPFNNTGAASPGCENGEAESYRYTPHNVSRRATNSHSRSPSPSGPPNYSTLAIIDLKKAFPISMRYRTDLIRIHQDS